MFDHPLIQKYKFEDVPLDRDIMLMDVKWVPEFEAALIKSVEEKGESAYSVGYYSHAAARAIDANSMELSWYPNTYDRFHELRTTLLRSEFICCVASWQYDYDPIIFVSSEWITNLHLRGHSVFALIDAINAKKALASGALSRSKLVELRHRIDEMAANNLDVAFVSFGDSLLLKSNFSVGMFDSPVKYNYDPEKILRLLPAIRSAYQKEVDLDIYAVVTQGSNEYYDDDLLYTSEIGHHISFNSLGLPFAQIQAIEQSARLAIKSGLHSFADAYLDECFYHSLRFKREFNKNKGTRFPYIAPMATGVSHYYPVSFDLLTEQLRPEIGA